MDILLGTEVLCKGKSLFVIHIILFYIISNGRGSGRRTVSVFNLNGVTRYILYSLLQNDTRKSGLEP